MPGALSCSRCHALVHTDEMERLAAEARALEAQSRLLEARDRWRTILPLLPHDSKQAEWIGEHAKKRPRAEIVAWNNKERDLRLSDLPPELQEFMENYIQRYVPRNRVVYHWFDVYDLEEQRI